MSESTTCFPLQSSIYSVAMKSIISLSSLILLGLIIAFHICEVQVIHLSDYLIYCPYLPILNKL